MRTIISSRTTAAILAALAFVWVTTTTQRDSYAVDIMPPDPTTLTGAALATYYVTEAYVTVIVVGTVTVLVVGTAVVITGAIDYGINGDSSYDEVEYYLTHDAAPLAAPNLAYTNVGCYPGDTTATWTTRCEDAIEDIVLEDGTLWNTTCEDDMSHPTCVQAVQFCVANTTALCSAASHEAITNQIIENLSADDLANAAIYSLGE